MTEAEVAEFLFVGLSVGGVIGWLFVWWVKRK
jgi:hypothetical protein